MLLHSPGLFVVVLGNAILGGSLSLLWTEHSCSLSYGVNWSLTGDIRLLDGNKQCDSLSGGE